MIFDLTRSYVPVPYVESRDYRTFLRQLGAEITVFKYNIDHLPDLYDADRCPAHLLPLLASMVGYTYNDNKSIASNRKIIKYFPHLIRNRGSEIGIKLAVALSVVTTPGVTTAYSTSNIIVSLDVENGVIYVYYPDEDVIDWGLVEVVRPVGMRIKFIRSDIGTSTESVKLKVTARSIPRKSGYTRPTVGESLAGFDADKYDDSNI